MESFVHIFKTVLGYYLYDVNRDKILGIPEEVYCYFDKGIKTIFLLQKIFYHGFTNVLKIIKMCSL